MASDAPLRFRARPANASTDPVESAQLAAGLRADLLLADEEPSYELLERATNGELSEDEAEALALRAEWDEELARELSELAELRDRLTGRGKSAPAPRRLSRVWRTAGLAAALLVAAIGVDRAIEQKAADSSYAGISQERTTPQPLFRDGFESGSSSSWTN